MGRSLNRVEIIGHLGRDPELKFTPQGTPICKFSVATSERYKDKQGEYQETTEWHNIVAWQKLAEICGQYLKKGSQVYIDGKIRTESWDDKESGQKKYRTTIVANQLIMLGGKGEGQGRGRDAGQDDADYDQTQIPRSPSGPAQPMSTPIDDSDIPF